VETESFRKEKHMTEPTPAPVKPGYKTTEFWLSLLAILVGAVIASGVISPDGTGTAAKIVGGLVTLLGALGYTVQRTTLKSQ
jgi:hypothetical protein